MIPGREHVKICDPLCAGKNAPEEMAFFNQFVDKGLIERLQHVVNSDFGHVTYTEAIKILEKHNDEFDYKVFWGMRSADRA